MTRKERMLAAFCHHPVDRFPAGELSIENGLISNILKRPVSSAFIDPDRDVAIREALDMDLIVLSDWPSWNIGTTADGHSLFQNIYGCTYYTASHSRHVATPILVDPSEAWKYPIPDVSKVDPRYFDWFSENTDFFIFGQIGGPVSMLDESLDFEDFLVWALTDTKDLSECARRIMIYEVNRAKLYLDHGANGIVIADDMAYNSGTFLSPEIMDELVFPFYKNAVDEIKAYKDVPVVLHSDGDINKVLDRIIDCGFDGLQSLQPSANMNIYELKKSIGDKITLWGNMDLDYLMTRGTPQEVSIEAARLMGSMGNTGFILSTCNTLIDAIPTENALALYNTDRSIR